MRVMRSSLKALTGGVLALPVLAMAAVPTGAEAVFTSLATDSATVLGYAFTAMAAITGGWIVFRIVKKGAHKVA